MDEQKRKNWRWLAGVMGLLLLGVLLLLSFFPAGDQGPRLRGRPAVEWLEALVETNALSTDAIAVFQEAGGEVVPFLASQATGYSWLSERVSDAQERFGVGSRTFRWIDGVTYFRLRMEVERRRTAVMVLGKLGTTAQAATPTLLELLTEDYVNGTYDTYRQSNAIIAMLLIAPTSDEGARAVIKHLRSYSPDPGLAAAAYRTLEGLGPECREVIPSLITSLRYRKQNQYRSDTSRKASSTVIAYSEWADLLDYLQSTNAPVREGAAFRLHEMFRVTPKLIADSTNQAIIARCLSDKDPNVKLLATECLAFASPPLGDLLLPVIQQLCQDPDYAIRLRAVELLRNVGRNHTATQELLESIAKNDPARVVRVWAAEAVDE